MNDEILYESKELLNVVLTKEQKEVIERASEEIKKHPESYNIDFFWKLDASIGGIGGYCMPLDPRYNPFPAGIGRDLFRPLQYAASDIEAGKNIHIHARHAVQDAGLHLEMASKFVLYKEYNKIGKIISKLKKFTLGQCINEITKRKILQQHLIKPLKPFVRLYNKTKHRVNQDEERERLFSPTDALIFYTSARIFGKELLKPYYPEILKSIGKYLDRLKGLNMNL